MIFKRCAALAICAALLAGLSASALAAEFPDVAPEHWAYAEIGQAADYGLIRGMEDGSFRPGDTLDRASFLTILSRMFSWPEAAPAQPSYADVPESHWAYPAVEAAVAQGVLVPAAGEEFHPGGYITRETMAVLLVRALGYETLAQDLAGGELPFPDVTEHGGHIAVAAAIGLTNGIPDAATGQVLFLPDSFATRDQAAAMLARVYGRYISRVEWLHGFYAFSSYSQIGYTAQMDGVSVGWARLELDGETGPWLNGSKTDTNDWVKPADYQEALDLFQAGETPCNLNVYADTRQDLPLADGSQTSVLEALLSSPERQEQAIAALTAGAEGYAGLTIDFEGLKTETYRTAFSDFLARLRAALPGDKTLYVCVPPDDWYKGYDYRALGEACDRVILMAHDYQWTNVPEGYVGTRSPDSPVTPLPRIFRALQAVTDPETGVRDRNKLALQISFGTAGFEIDGEGRLASTQIYHPGQPTIARRLAQPDTVITYDDHHRNSCAVYYGDDGTTRYQLWYEDARSVADKLDLARMFGITGVSLWRLGNIPSLSEAPELYYDAWSAVLSQR